MAHRKLKAEFAKQRKIRPVGVATALQIVGLPMEGGAPSGGVGCLECGRLVGYLQRVIGQADALDLRN